MGILEFIAVGTVDHVGDRFRLHQVHSAVQERTTRVFAGFRQPHAIDTLDDLNQFADDNRVAVRVQFQHVFASVGIRTFKKDVEETVDDLRRFAVIANKSPVIPRGRQFRLAGHEIFHRHFAKQQAHHLAHLGTANTDGGYGTHASRRHRGYNRLGIHIRNLVFFRHEQI